MESPEHVEPEKRDVTLDEALAMAIFFHRRGQLAEADEVYRTVLAALPEQPTALHYSGLLAHQRNEPAEALVRMRRSLELEPGHADWHSNVGVVLKSEGRIDEAVDAFRQALALDPGHVNAHSNLGVLLRAQGHVDEAEAEYRRAIALNPGHTDAHHNLGVLLSATGRLREAVRCYCKVITLSPQHGDARRLMALAHSTLGEHDKAVAIFEKWAAEEPDNPIVRHMLAACSGRDVPARASDAFVEKIFDGFAASFDSKLAGLHYRAPSLVEAMLADSGVPANRQLDVLDAGCGTGLCGPLVAPWSRRLVGVDLSGKMLAQARERRTADGQAVYDELHQAELTAFLQSHRDVFNVVVSADTLVYFGDLGEVVPAIAAALRPNGVAIFTLEDAGDESAAPFHIDSHGRYAHRPEYVVACLAASELEADVVPAELRLEAGIPVKGLLVRARKPRVADAKPVAAMTEVVAHG
jgi:predicted TPR repeat methyltransferase